MNRKDLCTALATSLDTSAAEADRFLTALEEAVVSSVARGDEVTIPGFLAIKTVERAARTGRNPQTGEALTIPARTGVKVTPGTRLRGAVDQGQ